MNKKIISPIFFAIIIIAVSSFISFGQAKASDVLYEQGNYSDRITIQANHQWLSDAFQFQNSGVISSIGTFNCNVSQSNIGEWFLADTSGSRIGYTAITSPTLNSGIQMNWVSGNPNVIASQNYRLGFYNEAGNGNSQELCIDNNLFKIQIFGTINNPVSLTALGQYKSDGTTPINEGQTTTESSIILSANVSGSSGIPVKLEAELKPISESFVGQANLSSDFSTSGVLTVLASNLSDGQYHWQARVVDSQGTASDWQEFGTVGNVDFAVDQISPTTAISLSGTLGKNNWYTSNIQITLSAQDSAGGTGVSKTEYSLDNGATWLTYSNPFTISQEAISSILYRSEDIAGNTEQIKSQQIQIDKTSPEAKISSDPTSKDLLVEGVDNLSSTTVSKDTAGNYVITDKAGHTTKLIFNKTYLGKILTYAKLTGIQYDNNPAVKLPNSYFLYIWNLLVNPQTLISQTIYVDNTYTIEAAYDKKSNKTTVLLKQKGIAIKKQEFSGLKIVKLTTSKGVVGYEF